MDKSLIRQKVLEEFQSLVFGPRGGENEFIEGRRGVTLRYLTGILFPKGQTRQDLSQESEEYTDEENNVEAVNSVIGDFSADEDNPLSMANEELPSSVGMSFVVRTGTTFNIECSGARYKPIESEFNNLSGEHKKEFAGTPAVFSIKILKSNKYSVKIQGGGSQYEVGDLIKISGDVFGANSPENDLIIEVKETDGNTSIKKINADGKARNGYVRDVFATETIMSSDIDDSHYFVFGKRAKIRIFSRPSLHQKDCELLSISLENVQEIDLDDKRNKTAADIENRIYQVGFKCFSDEPVFRKYDSVKEDIHDLDESILALQYSDSPIFAVGHGASVLWDDENDSKSTRSIEVSYIPKEYIYRPTFDKLTIANEKTFKPKDINIFDIESLSNENSDRNLIQQGLYEFCDFYDEWIVYQESKKNKILVQAEDYLINEMKRCSKRIRHGVDLIIKDEYWLAFKLANRAMLYQIMQRANVQKWRSEREGKLDWPIDPSENIDSTTKYDINELSKRPAWRPFQLAFFLMTYLDLENEGVNRDKVDLIWFSTGGGKTEAYLFLSSYELIRRRIRYDSTELGSGTGVITRYTLRFLTADQFARTVSLCCALEKIRHENLTLLGEAPMDVGIYVGDKTTYNWIKQAQEALVELINGINLESHLFQIVECPSCGTNLVPKNGQIGISIEKNSVRYRCLNNHCDFHNKYDIPVKTVDEHIYRSPPSFLIGTVDKFAMLAWRSDSGAIFGSKHRGENHVPPSLVIQDELHLISGPLGTISAVYEAGFDTLIKKKQSDLNLPQTGAKYIASSATIRESDKQIKRITGRESMIFPPRGLRINDSFFTTTDKDKSQARQYLGIMPQGWRSTSASYAISGALLQSVRFVAAFEELKKEDLDFLWTTLCFCNSKRELGLVNSSVNQEIQERMKVCSDAQGNITDRYDLQKEEISSNVKHINKARDKLFTTNKDSGVIDFVPCTTMISVGVDIDRLGLMIVNGQPKTTAEYIQASSRVGRDPSGKGPGLVVTLYSPAKPRDRSHYEQFKSFHQTLYRLVEPTSVTPGSDRALERSLHASLIIALRHGIPDMRDAHGAMNMKPDRPEIADLINSFKARITNIYAEDFKFERNLIISRIDEIIDKWSRNRHGLQYSNKKDRSANCLMIEFDEKQGRSVGLFRTMTSMRSVDTQVTLRPSVRQIEDVIQ